MKVINWIFFRTRFLGRENIPKQGGFIFASNHLSNIDPFILGISVRRRFGYVAKESLFKHKLLAWFLYNVGAIPIKRDTADFRAIREALKRLKNGTSIILFPEGTRGAGSREKRPQPGVGLIAVRSNVPVLPVYIKNSDKALPNGAKWFRFQLVEVMIGKPIHFDKNLSYPEISATIMQKVRELAVV